ncbi:hypothetical protein [Wolbachia endosymbiont of Brugia pahangi]|uniref:hypothetical protein n=1 Tax=Wolbachia endosymbiont of Brugia pahangi TaxID=96495 RepID=UPI001435B709|nr:hypothetical protein [Wolbachia endosymbiont of Brugia pahangi]QIT36434.1 hypothetical protein WBP_0196 [Wolbachia endosymbiont of Brugia pahangi]
MKKCVFKIAKGSLIETDGKKCYKVKLVEKNPLGEIEQEVTFNEHLQHIIKIYNIWVSMILMMTIQIKFSAILIENET